MTGPGEARRGVLVPGRFNQKNATIVAGPENPTVDPVKAKIGSIFLNHDTGAVYKKTGTGNTAWAELISTASATEDWGIVGCDVRSGLNATGVDDQTVQVDSGRVVTDIGGREVVNYVGGSLTVAGSVVGPGGVDTTFVTQAAEHYAIFLITGDNVSPALVCSNRAAVAEDTQPDLSDASFNGYARSKLIALLAETTGIGDSNFREQLVKTTGPNIRRTYYLATGSGGFSIPDASAITQQLVAIGVLPPSDKRRRVGVRIQTTTGTLNETQFLYHGGAAAFTLAQLGVTSQGTAFAISAWGELMTAADGRTVAFSSLVAGVGPSTADVFITWFDYDLHH